MSSDYLKQRLAEIAAQVTPRAHMLRRRKRVKDQGLTAPAVCDLCGGTNKKGRSLTLDHCHETGALRGWLCHKCNLGLGLLGDTPAALRKALKYLEKTPKARGFHVSADAHGNLHVLGERDAPSAPSGRVADMLARIEKP